MRTSILAALFPLFSFLATNAAPVQDLGDTTPVQAIPPDPAHWEKTPASGMRDVAITANGTIWLVGSNGTIWHTLDGEHFYEQDKVSGFGRIGAGDDDSYVFAVGGENHTLWHYKGPGTWTQTPASEAVDVTVDTKGVLWMVGTNGTVWHSSDKGQTFKQIKASGFCRIATHSQVLWAVGCNGTLWSYRRPAKAGEDWDGGEWRATEASGVADIASDNMNSLWLTGKNGSVWHFVNLPLTPGKVPGIKFKRVSPPAGFTSIAAGGGKTYAVRLDGTVWRYKP